jgi:signal transduction histidine kinase
MADMLGRLGFAGRLMAIVLFALVALWAAGIGLLFMSETSDDIRGDLFPVPEQVVNIVELIEGAAPSARPAILKAVSSENLRVDVAHDRPQEGPETTHLPIVERFLSLYLGAVEPREVIAVAPRGPSLRWRDWHLGDYWRNVQRSVRFAVSLRGGDYAMFEVRGPAGRRVFGMPPGFGVGALGALIGVAAMIAIAREARPLRALSKALGQFTGDTAGPLVEPGGAPEIRGLIVSVNEMRSRISELMRGRTLLLGAISHDLKTYITRLRLRVELLPEEGRDKAVRDLDEMTRLLEDALAVARGGLASPRREPVELRALLSGLVEDRLHAGARIRADIGEQPLRLKAEPVAMRRLFGNLIDNALRFAPHCIVRLWRDGGEAVVCIDDDGPGIPPEAREAVFEPFSRLETSRSRTTGGSGLGLAIVKQIADAHGARISLSTSPEGGLRASVAVALSRA